MFIQIHTRACVTKEKEAAVDKQHLRSLLQEGNALPWKQQRSKSRQKQDHARQQEKFDGFDLGT